MAVDLAMMVPSSSSSRFLKAHEEVDVIFVLLTSPTCALAQLPSVEMLCPITQGSFRFAHIHGKVCRAAQLWFSVVQIFQLIL